jgi:hypothetical protein
MTYPQTVRFPIEKEGEQTHFDESHCDDALRWLLEILASDMDLDGKLDLIEIIEPLHKYQGC